MSDCFHFVVFLALFVIRLLVWFAEYDDICDDSDMVIDVDSSVDLQASETTPQLNHVYDRTNGDLENDLDSVDDGKHVPASIDTVRRVSSVASVVSGPVNGIKMHEHNLVMQKLAVVEVKKPGKGIMFAAIEISGLQFFLINLLLMMLIFLLRRTAVSSP